MIFNSKNYKTREDLDREIAIALEEQKLNRYSIKKKKNFVIKGTEKDLKRLNLNPNRTVWGIKVEAR